MSLTSTALPALGPRQRQAVKQIDAGDEVERVGEGPVDDLRTDRPLAQHDRRSVAVKAVGDQQAIVDLVDRDRRQTIPRVGIALDREVVEAVAQVEVRVEDQIVQRDFANFHGGDSCVVSANAQLRGEVSNPTLSAYDRQRITAACVNFLG